MFSFSVHSIAPKGSKTVSAKTRGKEKTRFTAIPAMMANGYKLKMFNIFKGLKKVPKGLKILTNIVVAVAEKGSVNTGKITFHPLKLISCVLYFTVQTFQNFSVEAGGMEYSPNTSVEV